MQEFVYAGGGRVYPSRSHGGEPFVPPPDLPAIPRELSGPTRRRGPVLLEEVRIRNPKHPPDGTRPRRAPRLSRTACALLAALTLSPCSTLAVSVRVASFNTLFGVGTPGSTEYNAVRDILLRVDADIIGFQELGNGDFPNWVGLAEELGYGYTAYGGNGPLAGSFYLGYFSRFPITEAHEVKEPAGATEFTRWPLQVAVDVPGALNPLIVYNVHNKASSGSANEFRRGIELMRTVSNIVAWISTYPLDTEYIILGDFNDNVDETQTASFSSLPSGLPASYSLGGDVVFPVPYRLYPSDRGAEADLFMMQLTHEDSANRNTYISGGRLDYILVSEEIVMNSFGPPVGEIYNSDADDGVGGLPKAGAPLSSGTSSAASDHFLLFADLNMVDQIPCLNPVLLLSELVDHPGNQGANFIECYNSGVDPLDLTGYEAVVYLDGNVPITVPLGGVINGGETLVVAADAGLFAATYGFAPDLADATLLQVDGNDVVALKDPDDRLYDIYGVLGEPAGSNDFSMSWAYPDRRVERALGISDPFNEWLAVEWNITNDTLLATPGTHTACDQASVVIDGPFLQPTRPGISNSVTVTAMVLPNLPASNLTAAAHVRLNLGAFVAEPMSLLSNHTWSTSAFFPSATNNDVMDYYVAVSYDGPGGTESVTSPTNAYLYPAAPGTGSVGGVFFNEVRANDASTDDREFVELIAPAGTDLTGYSIVHYNGSDSVDSPLFTFVFPAFDVPDDGITDSSGNPLGFVVLSQDSNLVAGTDFLLPGSVQNGPDGLLLYDNTGNILDAVAWGGAGDLDTDDPGTVSTAVDPTSPNYLHVLPGSTGDDDSLQAPNNVFGDTGANWDSLAATPGAINTLQTSGDIVVPSGDLFSDTDEDGILDFVDNCPDTPNPLQTDLDNDGAGDACDDDRDGDGILNLADNCPDNANPGQEDLDGDGEGDACDLDRDNDGVFDDDDNCPETANADQADLDDDGVGDVCDPDDDNDGVLDEVDNCPALFNPGQEDLDGNGEGDACDDDIDGDGVLNAADNCPATPNPDQVDSNDDGVGDACAVDSDGDGVEDSFDNCPATPNPLQADVDLDGIGDACDPCSGSVTNAVVLNETFDGGLPPGWTILANATPGLQWRFDDPGFRGNNTGGTGVFAICESRLFNDDMDTEMLTPTFHLEEALEVALEFKTDFDWRTRGQDEVADVDVSVNGPGGPWQNVWRREGADYRGPATETVDLSSITAGGTGVVVRFHYYNARRERSWEIDDVRITATSCFLPAIDTDGDGLDDALDADDDNDGVEDTLDPAPLDPAVCGDADGDTCDDCSVGVDGFGPAADADVLNDGTDTDADGLCDTGDLDDDNDTLPDDWESMYGLDPLVADSIDPNEGATGDPDMDGYSNRDEFTADTNPTNSNSFIRVNLILRSSPTSVHFDASTGRVYQLQYADHLQTGAWHDVESERLGVGPDDSIQDPGVGEERYYRIIVRTP